MKLWKPPIEQKPEEDKLDIETDTTSTADMILDQSTSEKSRGTVIVKDHRRIKKSLTKHGKASMTIMGERFRKRFQDLIPPELDSKTEVSKNIAPSNGISKVS